MKKPTQQEQAYTFVNVLQIVIKGKINVCTYAQANICPTMSLAAKKARLAKYLAPKHHTFY
jgi:hypothetical protein